MFVKNIKWIWQLKLAQLSKADSIGGGASRVAEELADALRITGHEVTHFASYTSHGFGEFQRSLLLQNKWMHFLHKKTLSLSRRLGIAEIVPLELLALWRNNISQFDILHFHDLTSAISPFTLIWLSRKQPVVWTLHDCSPFTGGCLFPMDCNYYKSECRKCPQIGVWPLDSICDCTHIMQAIKSRLHRTKRIHYVAPSKWMARKAFESGKLPVEPVVIANGVNTETYKPVYDRLSIRRSLNLPDNNLMLLVSANNLRSPRKGIRFAAEAIRAITPEFRPWVLLMGSMRKEDECIFDGLHWISTGYVSDPKKCALYYACADAFLFCSLADNQPLAVLESLSCGTPVLGFATGGLPEIVQDDLCGKLTPSHDIQQFVEILRLFSNNKIGQHWSHESRNIAVSQYSMHHHLDGHLRLYNSIMDKLHIKKT